MNPPLLLQSYVHSFFMLQEIPIKCSTISYSPLYKHFTQPFHDSSASLSKRYSKRNSQLALSLPPISNHNPTTERNISRVLAQNMALLSAHWTLVFGLLGIILLFYTILFILCMPVYCIPLITHICIYSLKYLFYPYMHACIYCVYIYHAWRVENYD